MRRGTLSLLKKFGLAVEDINLHMGWAYDSQMFKVYFR
jgi:hypothetical protein